MTETLEVMPLDSDQQAKAEFRAGLEEIRLSFRESGRFMEASRVGRVLRSDRRFDRVFNRAQDKAIGEWDSNADGEFLKWFLEWLEDGGWELILEIIKALMALG